MRMLLSSCSTQRSASEGIGTFSRGLQNEYDSGNPFYLDTERGCNSEDACRCANELVHELTESQKRSRRQFAAPSCHGGSQSLIIMRKTTKTSSGLMDSFRHRVAVRIYILLLATLLSKLSRNSERSASVAIQVSISRNHSIQLKPCSCRGVAECGDPPVQCSSESISVKCPKLGCNQTPTFCKTHAIDHETLQTIPLVLRYV